jgi:hypothetical protein
MKTSYIQMMALLLITATQLSCKKTEDKILPTASFTIRNCVTDGTFLFAKLNGSENVSFADKNTGIAAPFGTNSTIAKEYGLSAGELPVKLYAFPDSLTAVTSASYNLKAGGIYSLFVSGTKTSIDTLFTKDDIPDIAAADSVILIRIVNLANTGAPVSVNITGEPANTAMQNLNYKGVTKFISFGVKKAQHNGDSFSFEIRNSTTNALLTTFMYYWNFPGPSGGGTHFMSKAATVVIANTGPVVKCLVINPTLKN